MDNRYSQQSSATHLSGCRSNTMGLEGTGCPLAISSSLAPDTACATVTMPPLWSGCQWLHSAHMTHQWNMCMSAASLHVRTTCMAADLVHECLHDSRHPRLCHSVHQLKRTHTNTANTYWACIQQRRRDGTSSTACSAQDAPGVSCTDLSTQASSCAITCSCRMLLMLRRHRSARGPASSSMKWGACPDT